MTTQTNRPWLALFGLCLGMCVTNGFARFAYGLILPAMREDLGWTYVQAGWLNTANALGYLTGAILTLLLIRRVNAAKLYAFGMITTAVSLMVTGLNEALWWQSVWRVAAGLFGAMSFATSGALATQLFAGDAKRNALAIALLFGLGGGLGIALAGGVIPPLLTVGGVTAWPWAWGLVGGAGLLFLPLGIWAGWALRPPVAGWG
ncbi:MAG: YbfB/YjiJ family MFS transporter, partial [Paracoccaceae bacterium]